MSQRSAIVAMAVLAMLSLVLSACGGSAAPATPEVKEIVVKVTEFAFSPAEIRAKVGQPMRIMLQNDGAVLHDMSSIDAMVDMMQGEGASHDMGNTASQMKMHVAAEASQKATLEFKPTQAGTYEFFCSVAGHKEAGMVGKLIVEP
ncbi:MAG TPA: cupredoxin domain-containing protein [Anaerolineae bacterium]